MPAVLAPCVIDCSVVIDLHVGRILRAVFSLPLSLMATQFLIEELDEPDRHELQRFGLLTYHLSGADIAEIGRLRGQYSEPSNADLSALAAAKATKALLLTGDRRLRADATKEKVPVRGTLWLLDELVRLEILAAPVAAESLRLMLQQGRRLPKNECEARLKQWSSGKEDANET